MGSNQSRRYQNTLGTIPIRDLPLTLKSYAIIKMKVSSVVLVTLAAADKDKKVPPRTPAQRLNRLQIFSAEWLNDNLANLPSKENWISKFEVNAERMMDAYNRPNCGFFDPSLPYGGPDPNPELDHNDNPRRPVDRKRREDSSESFTDEFGELLR